MPENKGVKEKYKKDLATGLFTGVIIGILVFIGTYAGNFLWWWQLQHPKYIFWNGIIYLFAFLCLGYFLIKVAIKNLKK